MASKYKHPSEFPKKKSRVPISARLDKGIKNQLETAAKKEGLTFGEMVENVLEGYSEWLNSKSNKVRKK